MTRKRKLQYNLRIVSIIADNKEENPPTSEHINEDRYSKEFGVHEEGQLEKFNALDTEHAMFLYFQSENNATFQVANP